MVQDHQRLFDVDLPQLFLNDYSVIFFKDYYQVIIKDWLGYFCEILRGLFFSFVGGRGRGYLNGAVAPFESFEAGTSVNGRIGDGIQLVTISYATGPVETDRILQVTKTNHSVNHRETCNHWSTTLLPLFN